MLAWLSRLILLAAGAWSARAYARDFVRAYIRQLVRDRLLTGLFLTVSQLALLAATAFCVRRFGDPLGGRLLGSALVWLLIAFNVTRFVRNTLPELVEMELVVLAVCLVLGLSVRLGVSSTFQLLAPWQEFLAIRR